MVTLHHSVLAWLHPLCSNRWLPSRPKWCANPRGGDLSREHCNEDLKTNTSPHLWLVVWELARLLATAIFKRTGMNYHSMTVQSNSLSRGAEATVSRQQERAHQKAPIWGVSYRDEQWANLPALCQKLLENHHTPLKMTFKFNVFISLIFWWQPPATSCIFSCSVYMSH